MTERVHAVIGDLVGSRRLPDRGAGHRALTAALDEVNEVLAPVQPFGVTTGDEYQGACTALGDAVLAALLVRLTVLPVVDVRCGIGHGATTVYDAERLPMVQDGPAWWAARAAIDALGGHRDARRTWFVGEGADRVNAFLVCRDQVVDRLNARGVRILRLALLGTSQKAIAEAEGVWPSAVSQQFSRGVGAVVDAQHLFASDDSPGAPRRSGA
jgi:SatD family (SatD)